MAVAAQLFRLEQLDAELDGRRAELAGIRRRLQRDPDMEAAEARLDQARVRAQEGATRQRRLEGELADVEARITRDHQRMYGGQIVDPRELSSLEKEMQAHAGRRDAVEEQLLAAMEELESVQQEVEDLSRAADDLRARRETDRPALQRQAESVTDALAGLQAERDALAASIDERTMNHYLRLRKSSGHAVSHVSNGVCQWCRVAIPPKDVQHARAGTLVACSNCARILYVG